jgi:glycosyltransferase involved in cell wall biosynthesis
MERYYEKKVRSNEMTSIYNGIEIPDCSCKISREEEDQILKLKSNYHIIGVTARLIFLKGIDQVIKSLLVNKDFALVIIGNGEKEKELIQLSKELEVDDRCLFLGYKKCVLPYLKLFDVYAMSSRSEGFGLSVMEAASQKVPVVCSNLPVFEEIFTNNEVVSFELENIDSLATAFREAVCERPKFSEALYSKFNANFTADKMANNYLQLYQRLLYR